MGDQLLDTAFDTVPEIIDNVQQGKSAGEVAKDAAKNVAVNAAFNLGSEAVPEAVKAVKNSVTGNNAKAAAQAEADVMRKFYSGDYAIKEAGQAPQYDSILNELYNPATQPKQYDSILNQLYPSRNTSQLKQISESSADAAAKGFPQRVDGHSYNTVVILQSRIDEIAKEIESIPEKKIRIELKKRLKKVFAGRTYTVNGTTVKAVPYSVDVSANGIGESVMKQKMTPETIAILERMDDVIADAKFVASENDKRLRPEVLRSDVFRTNLNIGDAGETIAKTRVNALSDGSNKIYYVGGKTNGIDTSAPWAGVSTAQHGILMHDSNSIIPNSAEKATTAAKEISHDGLGAKTSDFVHKQNISKVASNTYENATFIDDITKNMAKQTNEPAIPDGMKERGYAESLRKKSDLPEEVRPEFVNNPEVYKALANPATFKNAENVFAQGIEDATNGYYRMLDNLDPAAVPLKKMISDEMILNGNTAGSVELLRIMSAKLTKSGQFSQAAVLALMKDDPLTAVQYIARDIDALNAAGKAKFKKK